MELNYIKTIHVGGIMSMGGHVIIVIQRMEMVFVLSTCPRKKFETLFHPALLLESCNIIFIVFLLCLVSLITL